MATTIEPCFGACRAFVAPVFVYGCTDAYVHMYMYMYMYMYMHMYIYMYIVYVYVCIYV